jgi:hypothetical protein
MATIRLPADFRDFLRLLNFHPLESGLLGGLDSVVRQHMLTRSPALLLLLIALAVNFSESSTAAATNNLEKLTVHGRLTYSNGNPSSRIWMVGTKRILGVRESENEVAHMPKALRDLMSWEREIFADFVVEPLTPYKPGVMQMVRVVSASNIVVTEKEKIVLRRDKL